MRSKRLLSLALMLAGVSVVAACGGGHTKKAASTTTAAPPPATDPATTTTPPPPPTDPLTGLPAGDPAHQARPVLAIKIDNAGPVRPQFGINQADVVYEEQVEGGLTRFAALFHSQDAARVEPVRSARSTDIAILTPLNRPLFGYAGANAVFEKEVHAAALTDLGVQVHDAPYHRDKSRAAPHNLFTSTDELYRLSPKGAAAPGPLFTFRPQGQHFAVAGVQPAGHITVAFPAGFVAQATWDWDTASSSWMRGQSGTPDVDDTGTRIAAANVIVQVVSYHNTGLVDPSGSPVPEANLVGQGDALICSDGQVVAAHWSKPSIADRTEYTDAAGTPIGLTPGRTWIELAPPGTATTHP